MASPLQQLLGVFTWWDDALALATERARDTGRRHRVFFYAGRWMVRSL